MKTPAAPAPANPPPALSRDEWSMAFARKVDDLRGEMGAKYLATVAAGLYVKHRDDDPEQVAASWAAEHEASGL